MPVAAAAAAAPAPVAVAQPVFVQTESLWTRILKLLGIGQSKAAPVQPSTATRSQPPPRSGSSSHSQRRDDGRRSGSSSGSNRSQDGRRDSSNGSRGQDSQRRDGGNAGTQQGSRSNNQGSQTPRTSQPQTQQPRRDDRGTRAPQQQPAQQQRPAAVAAGDSDAAASATSAARSLNPQQNAPRTGAPGEEERSGRSRRGRRGRNRGERRPAEEGTEEGVSRNALPADLAAALTPAGIAAVTVTLSRDDDAAAAPTAGVAPSFIRVDSADAGNSDGASASTEAAPAAAQAFAPDAVRYSRVESRFPVIEPMIDAAVEPVGAPASAAAIDPVEVPAGDAVPESTAAESNPEAAFAPPVPVETANASDPAPLADASVQVEALQTVATVAADEPVAAAQELATESPIAVAPAAEPVVETTPVAADTVVEPVAPAQVEMTLDAATDVRPAEPLSVSALEMSSEAFPAATPPPAEVQPEARVAAVEPSSEPVVVTVSTDTPAAGATEHDAKPATPRFIQVDASQEAAEPVREPSREG